MIEFQPDITKEFILSKASEEEIFELYGVPVVPYMFISPLRKDRYATCKFYRRRNGKLILRDYAGYFWGDCFDLAVARTGKGFHDTLQDIARKLKLVESGSIVEDLVRIPAKPVFHIEPVTNDIRVKRLEWTHEHYKFWEQIGVSKSTLTKFKVAPLDRAWLNGEQIFWYGVQKEVAFVYHFPGYGPYEYKLYFPFRDKMRFVHGNANILQGYHQLPEKGDFLVVTKSYKDVICMYEFGIPAIAPMSENQIVSEAEAKELMTRFPFIIGCYDIDKLAGVKSMQKMKRLYGWKPMFFYSRMKKQLQPKDFTDYFKKYGRYETYLLVETIKSNF